MHIDTLDIEMSVLCLNRFYKMMYFYPLRLFFFILVNSADPDEMPPYATFLLDLHCFPNDPLDSGPLHCYNKYQCKKMFIDVVKIFFMGESSKFSRSWT